MEDDMASGEWAKINFYNNTAGECVASKLRREEAGERTLLRIEGKIDTLEGSTASVGGITIALGSLGEVLWTLGGR